MMKTCTFFQEHIQRSHMYVHSHMVCELYLDMLSDPHTFVFTLIHVVIGLKFIRWQLLTDFVQQNNRWLSGCSLNNQIP